MAMTSGRYYTINAISIIQVGLVFSRRVAKVGITYYDREFGNDNTFHLIHRI